MTVYLGVDFHARQQTVSYLTTEDGEIRQRELDHGQPDEVRSFYQQFAGQQVIVGFEASGYAAWFEELLEELGYEIWIGHATAIRLYARRRQKNDRRDADLILDLLLRGDFPRIHRYSAASREVLQPLRYRQRLVKMRTMVVNSLVFMASSRGVSLRMQLKSRRGVERLQQMSLPEPLSQQRDELCQLLLELKTKIETVEQWLEGDLARVYKRVWIRRGHAKAKVAVGRRLLVRAFIMLRDEIDYAEFHDVASQLGLPGLPLKLKCLSV